MNSFTDSLDGLALLAWEAFIWAGMLGGWVFVVLYWVHTKGRWIHGRMARHLMAMSVSVSQALTAYMMRIQFGDFPGRTAVMFASLVFLVLVVWWRTIMFVRESRAEKRRSREPV